MPRSFFSRSCVEALFAVVPDQQAGQHSAHSEPLQGIAEVFSGPKLGWYPVAQKSVLFVVIHEQNKGLNVPPESDRDFFGGRIHSVFWPVLRRLEGIAHLVAGLWQGASATSYSQLTVRQRQSTDIKIAGGLFDPAAINQQQGLVCANVQRRKNIVSVTAVDDDVIENDLTLAIHSASCPQILK